MNEAFWNLLLYISIDDIELHKQVNLNNCQATIPQIDTKMHESNVTYTICNIHHIFAEYPTF